MYRPRGIPPLRLSALAWLVAGTLSAQEEEGWVNLLPENDLSKHWTTEGNWGVNDDGVITLTPRPGESGWTPYGSYLWLEGEYDDFEIMFDYKLEKDGNSGFYFNVGDKADPVKTGIEVQIYDSGSKPADAELTDHDSGGIIPRSTPDIGPFSDARPWRTGTSPSPA